MSLRKVCTSQIRAAVLVPVLVVTLLAGLLAGQATALEPGQKAPDFELPLLDGSGSLSLASLRGKVVYIDIWASWCPPCLEAVPALEAMRSEFPSDRFQILAVNVDKKISKARKFLKKKPVGYPSVSDPNGIVPKNFQLETMPTSYLIDEKGVIRYVHKGFREGDIEEIRKQIQGSLQ